MIAVWLETGFKTAVDSVINWPIASRQREMGGCGHRLGFVVIWFGRGVDGKQIFHIARGLARGGDELRVGIEVRLNAQCRKLLPQRGGKRSHLLEVMLRPAKAH